MARPRPEPEPNGAPQLSTPDTDNGSGGPETSGGTLAGSGPAPCTVPGEGESLLTLRREAYLVTRAAQLGWPVSPEARSRAVQRAQQLLSSDSHKDWVAGIKALIHADAVNVSRERIAATERATGERNTLDTLRLALQALTPAQRAELVNATLPPRCLDTGGEDMVGNTFPTISSPPVVNPPDGTAADTGAPPGGFVGGRAGTEGVQPLPPASGFQNPPANETGQESIME